MPKVTEKYLKHSFDYNEIDTIIDKAGFWQKMCIKDLNTPIKTGKKGSFIGLRDEHGGLPILRCPSFFESKDIPKELLEKIKVFKFNFNIVKIQKYTRGVQGIARHTDKCLDMKEGESIFIYRINKDKKGYRSLYFCEKENKYKEQQFKLKDNSLIEIGSKENKRLVHYVPKEDGDEIAEECISFVFRVSGTFRLDSGHIYGQGAKYKTYEERMKHKDEKPKDIRTHIKDVVKMYKVENHNDTSENDCKEYIDACSKIIENTV